MEPPAGVKDLGRATLRKSHLLPVLGEAGFALDLGPLDFSQHPVRPRIFGPSYCRPRTTEGLTLGSLEAAINRMPAVQMQAKWQRRSHDTLLGLRDGVSIPPHQRLARLLQKFRDPRNIEPIPGGRGVTEPFPREALPIPAALPRSNGHAF